MSAWSQDIRSPRMKVAPSVISPVKTNAVQGTVTPPQAPATPTAVSPSPAKSLVELSPENFALNTSSEAFSKTLNSASNSPTKIRVVTEYWSPAKSPAPTSMFVTSSAVKPPALSSPVRTATKILPPSLAGGLQASSQESLMASVLPSTPLTMVPQPKTIMTVLSPEKRMAGSSTTPTSVLTNRSILSNLIHAPTNQGLGSDTAALLVNAGASRMPLTPSKSDRIILEELTGKKMDVEQAAKDSAAAAALCNHLSKDSLQRGELLQTQPEERKHAQVRTIHQYQITSAPQNPMKSLLTPTVPTMTPIVQNINSSSVTPNMIQLTEGQISPRIQIQQPPGMANPLIQWQNEAPKTPNGPTPPTVKRTVKKIIRKKIIIRKPNLLKRRMSDGSMGQLPPAKKPCYIMVDNNGVLHSMSNNHTFPGAPMVSPPESRDIRIAQVHPQIQPARPSFMKTPIQPARPSFMKTVSQKVGSLIRSAHKDKRKLKLPPRKFPKLSYDKFKPNPNFKVNPKLLKVSYSKENHQDGHVDLLRRKRSRKDSHKYKTDAFGFSGECC